jgi:hypothetical protein
LPNVGNRFITNSTYKFMKVTIAFAPPGGGETNYEIQTEVPSLPRQGDYISLRLSPGAMSSDFIVRRVRWHFDSINDNEYSSLNTVIVEAEFAIGPLSSDDHKACCSMYEARGKIPRHIEDSSY